MSTFLPIYRVSSALLGILFCWLSFASTVAAASDPEYVLVPIFINGRDIGGIHPILVKENQLSVPLETILAASEVFDKGLIRQKGRIEFDWHEKAMVLDTANAVLELTYADEMIEKHSLMSFSGEVYLDAVALNTLFGIQVELSNLNVGVVLSSDRPLPVDRRLMREQRWARFQESSLETQEAEYLSIDKPYGPIGNPRGNLQFSASHTAAGSALTASGRFDLEALYLSNDIVFSGNKINGLTTLRWSAGRRSGQGQVFGVSNLYEVRFGDISAQPLPLSARSSAGRGIFVTTAPLTRTALFDVTQVDGNALPGWDVELYRNGQLIDFVTVGRNGRYEFTDVPLGFGSNEFQVVLYGPQGQREERVLTQSFSSGQLQPGKWQLSASALENGKEIFGVGKQDGLRGTQASIRLDYGVSRRLTTGLFLNHLRRQVSLFDDSKLSGKQPGAKASLTDIGVVFRPAGNFVTTEWVGVYQDTGEYALRGAGRFSIIGFETSLQVEHITDDFVKSVRAQQDSTLLTDKIDLRARRSLGEWGSVALNYSYSARSNGKISQALGSSYRHRAFGGSFSHSLQLQRQGFFEYSQYRFLASRRWRNWAWRFDLQADGRSLQTLTASSVRFNTNYSWNNDRNFNLTAFYSLRSDQSMGLNAELSHRSGVATFGLSASYSDTGSWGVGLSVSFGLGSASGQPLMLLPQSRQRGGALVAKIFKDEAGDGVFSPGDEPIQAAGVRINGLPTEVQSDEDGRLMIFGLPTQQPVNIDLDIDSLPDPFLATNKSRLRFIPRLGFTHEINIPLQDAAFINGVVSMNEQPIAGVEIIARSLETGSKQSTLSLSGGYYSFERLAPGEWEIFVAEEALSERLKTSISKVTLEPGDSIGDINLSISQSK